MRLHGWICGNIQHSLNVVDKCLLNSKCKHGAKAWIARRVQCLLSILNTLRTGTVYRIRGVACSTDSTLVTIEQCDYC